MKDLTMESGGLKTYRAKRNFQQTSEPKPGRAVRKRGGRSLMFVIQKHDASRLHYDFRLEMDGALKSWAVPKGLPTRRGDRRLAIQVEDHPIDYADFEGTIPEGNYGAGTVMVWDTGTYSVHGTEPRRAWQEGKLHLTLDGDKLKGDWTLVRLKARSDSEKPSWLIFKSGEDRKALSVREEDQSVLTQRSMQEIAADNDASWSSDRPAKRTRSRPVQKKSSNAQSDGADEKIGFVPPMKCRLQKDPPKGPEWIYEIKFDGFRILALKNGPQVQLFSRSEKNLTARFPAIARAVGSLPCGDAVLDGEIVALDSKGRSSFQLLQRAQDPGGNQESVRFYIFDLLGLEGRNLQPLDLVQRKHVLQSLLNGVEDPIRFSGDIAAEPVQLMKEIRKRGLEGMIAKKRSSVYEPGLRTGNWVKVKCVNEQEFVIGGYTAPQGSRPHFGAVLVGYYEKGKLLFASKVGTGFKIALLKSLYDRFQELRLDQCPFANLPEKRSGRYGQGITATEMKKCVWIRPEIVCQIRFTEWTGDGHLRHPAFLGLREDKSGPEVKRERAE